MSKGLAAYRAFFLAGLLALFLFTAPAAHADCTNPARAEGAIIYNEAQNVPQVCAGSAWVALGVLNPAAGGGSCTNPNRTEGAIVYNVDNKVLQYCDGTDWKAVQAAQAPEVGCTPVHNNIQEASGTSANSLTLSNYAVPDVSNRILIVTAGAKSDTDETLAEPTTATFDGNSMTKAVSARNTNGGGGVGVGIFYMLNPPASTGDIVVNYTGVSDNVKLAAATFDCLKQQAPESTASATSDTGSITPVSSSSLVINAFVDDNGHNNGAVAQLNISVYSRMPANDGGLHSAYRIMGAGITSNDNFTWSATAGGWSEAVQALTSFERAP